MHGKPPPHICTAYNSALLCLFDVNWEKMWGETWNRAAAATHQLAGGSLCSSESITTAIKQQRQSMGWADTRWRQTCVPRLCRRRCDSRDVKKREGRGLTAQIKKAVFPHGSYNHFLLFFLWVWQRHSLTSLHKAYKCLTEVMEKHRAADGCFLGQNVPWITLNWTRGMVAQTSFILKQHSRVWCLRQRSGKCCYETQAVIRLSVWISTVDFHYIIENFYISHRLKQPEHSRSCLTTC